MIRPLTQASRFVPITVLVGLLAACGGAEQNGATEVLRPVKIFEVTQNNQARQRTFSGLSQSSQESRLSFKVGGTIIELPIQVGDALEPGQLIARLDASSYELEAEQARASLVQAQANQRNAESSYERIKNLYENSNASLNDLDNARAGAESAEAEVKAVQKAL
ncbi:MAG: biotin/lipoyl-binding protein, partial [Pseudomonadota bacterium]